MIMSRTKLKKVLEQYKDIHWVQDGETYKQVTISQTGKVSFRGEKQGVKIGRKRQFKINLKDHPNTLIFIRQGVMKGGIGICPPDVDECIVTENMPMFEIQDIEPNYLLNYLQSPQFKNDVNTLVPIGTAQKALHEKKLLELEIPYPDKPKQVEVVKKLEIIKESHTEFTLNTESNFHLISKLRQAILSEAIQGKLVSQDSKDEPASVLLEKIKAEKEKLIKEKKIRKEKPLPEITEEEIPYELPKGWIWTRLGEIGEIVGGGTPKTNILEYWSDDEISWLTPADLYSSSPKYITKGKRDISKLGLKKSSAQLMPKDTVVFSSRAPIGYVAIAKNELCTNQGFKSVVPMFKEMAEYIYFFLKSSAKEIDSIGTGTTFREVSGSVLKKILFPLPPLEEQKRIVAKVDQLMQLCDQLESQVQDNQKNAEGLMNAVLREAFASE